MQDKVDFIKSTMIGGVFFLIPLAVVVVVVGKLVEVMKGVARSLSPLIPVETSIGALVLNLLAVLVIVGFCFLAGLAAQRRQAKKIVAKLEETLLAALPGYAFVKGFSDNLRRSDEISESFIPVACTLMTIPNWPSRSSVNPTATWRCIYRAPPTHGRGRWSMSRLNG